MAILGAVLGLALGDVGVGLLGFVFGALLGWHWSQLVALRRRLDQFETQRHGAHVSQRQPDLVKPMAPTEAAVAAPTDSPQDASVPKTADVAERVLPPAMLTSAFDGHAVRAPDERPTQTTPSVGPPQPEPPSEPSALERIFRRARDWLFSGNLPVKVGILVLLFGVAAALKYSIDAGWLNAPISLRLAMVAAGGLAAIVWGWRNRALRPAFGLSLQGGGVGVLLLTTFAAFRLYQLLPLSIALLLVVVLVAAAAALAVLQDALALAVLGFLGGYLAPVLLSTGEGSHVALFSFYALLNLAVFMIAWLRHWRILNLLGFAFTFVVGLGWGAQYYRPEQFATVEPFLILFVLFYIGIVVLHALRAPVQGRDLVDGTILFGTPLLAFPLQAALLYEQPMMLAWSALALALVYAGLTLWLLRRRGHRLLGQSFGMLAIGFATLAVPLAFSSRTTSVTWALEGAALVWLGLRQRRLLPQLTGVGLHILAAVAYLTDVVDARGWQASPNEWLLLNGHALTVLLLSFTAFAISWLFERAGRTRAWVWPGFVLGLLWWLVAGMREIDQHLAPLLMQKATLFSLAAWVGFSALSLLVFALLRGRLHWPRLGWGVVLAFACSLLLAPQSQPLAVSGLHWPLNLFWLAWLACALFALSMLREPRQRGLSVAHVLFLATTSVVYGVALMRVTALAGLGADWVFMASFLPLVLLLMLTMRWPRIGAFPLAREFADYSIFWHVLASAVLVLAWIQSLTLSGDSAPLAYVPVFNPADLPQLAGLIAAASCFKIRRHPAMPALLAIAGFVWLSFAALRAVHHYAHLPWSPTLLESAVAQATLTIAWSLLGVLAWVIGSRRLLWSVWLVGAITLGVVLIKLAMVDRQYVGNLTGIVSFIAVGLLLVVVGRVAPTPPREAGIEQENRS